MTLSVLKYRAYTNTGGLWRFFETLARTLTPILNPLFALKSRTDFFSLQGIWALLYKVLILAVRQRRELGDIWLPL
jgi:hypothetical protein